VIGEHLSCSQAALVLVLIALAVIVLALIGAAIADRRRSQCWRGIEMASRSRTSWPDPRQYRVLP
jgi:hypothetical protein